MIVADRAGTRAAHDAGPSLRRRSAVLVTGASSGIGFATAVRLARRGTIVFAGIRRQVDGESLLRENSDRIKPLLLDVTDPQSVRNAHARIEGLREFRLDGLVNNAGIAIAGPIETLSLDDFRRQFDVNFFAVIGLIQEFLPMLRESGGRIVNVSSIGGRLAVPFLGAYSASKFALEGLSDALRLELRPFGVSVSVVEPGDVKTPIWRRSADAATEALAAAPADARARYDAAIRAMFAFAQRAQRSGSPPEDVARVIERALVSRRARARYVVGLGAHLRAGLALLPESVRDPLLIAALGLNSAEKEAAVPAERRAQVARV